jgi:hypothetical protein
MLSTKAPMTTSRETRHMETIEEFLARGGRVERIEAHPDPEGRVLRRGARDPRLQPLVPHTLRMKPS